MEHDHIGRYLIPPRGGGNPEPYTRATTWAATLDDRYGLEKWGQRMVLVGATLRQDLLAQAAAAEPDDKATLDRVVTDLVEAAGSSKGRNIGDALHKFTERVDRGDLELSKVQDPWHADIAAYRDAIARERFAVELVETVVIVPCFKVAGTLDRTVIRDRKRYILDVKTGQNLHLPSIAIQLALYAHAEFGFDDDIDQWYDLPEIDQQIGFVAHVPAGSGKCEVFALDLEAGWRGAQLADLVRGWRRSAVRASVTEPMTRREWIVQALTRMKNDCPPALQAVASRWPMGVPTLSKSDAHSDEQLEVIALLITQVEGEFRLSFGPADPAGTPKRNVTEQERKSA